MKTIVLIILAFVVGFFAYQNFGFSHAGSKITEDDGEIIIENGDNYYVAEVVSDYNEELRIYGINDNDTDGWTPLGYANYILVAGPLGDDTEACESNDAANAPFLNIIVDDKKVFDVIDDLKDIDGRRSATVIGEALLITEYYHKDEDHSDALAKQGKLDPSKAIIVSDIYVEDE